MRIHQFINEATMQLAGVRSKLLTPGVRRLEDAMTQNGFEIRIVGGAVRDLVLGLDPKDIDMATDATPQQMMELLDAVGIRHEPTGLQHGTITAILDGEPIEITTLRIDTDQDGRHAEVEFTKDWKLDAERRDLTFNAMSLSMDGTLHDYFGGVEDLKNNVARFVGDADARMQEDFLRILRYFRFQGRLPNPNWDSETMSAVTRNAEGLRKISGERIWAEMGKILSRPSRDTVLKQMQDAGVLATIDMPTNRIGMIRQVDGNDPVAVLSAALNTVGGLEMLRDRWKFSNDEYSKAKFILANRMNRFDEEVAQRMLAEPKIKRDHVFALAEALGKGALVQQLRAWTPPEFPVNGSDLTATGMKPGPNMGKALAKLRDEWEASAFKLTKDQLLKGI